MVILSLHLVLLGSALFGRRFSPFTLARLRDAIGLQALWLFLHAPPVGPTCWVLAQAPVLYLLFRHARAHTLMQAELGPQLEDKLRAIEADRCSGILEPDEAAAKNDLVLSHNATARALTALGEQMAWLGCVQLGLLLFAEGSIGVSWLLWVSLPTLVLSKLQDLALSEHVPHRLC